jgi:hypothetical protein
LVDWTPGAAEKIKSGEYRYFSSEYDDEWTNPQGTKFTDVIFGGALTNRPFLKDLLPVNLSEITSTQHKGGTLDPKKLREALKLAETATDEEVLAAIQRAGTQGPPTPTPAPPTPAPTASVQLTEADLNKMLTELPLFRQLQEGLVAAQTQLTETRTAAAAAAVRHRLSELAAIEGGRKFVLPPAVVDAVTEGSALSDPVKMSEAFLKGLEQLTKTGFVELGERGRVINTTEKSASVTLAEQVLATRTRYFQATGKQLSYTDAVRQIVAGAPELYEEYRRDSYAGKEE